MSDIWANAYNSQQKNLENSQSNVWDRQAQVVEQQEAARLENRKKYGVDLTDEEYAQINNLIADSENQEEEAHKIGSAILMSKQLGIPVDEAYTKVDDYQASLFSPEKVTNYRSGFTAIKDMLVMGSNNVRIGQIGNQIRKAQKRGDQEEVEILMQEYKALQEDNALRYDNAPRNWVTRVLKDGAQSLPYTAYSAGAAMLGSFIAPVAGTLAAFGTSSSLMAGQAYLDMLDKGIRPEIADRVSIISGPSQGLVETALGEVISWAGSGAHLLGNKVIGKELRNKLTDSIAESLQRKFYLGAGSKVAAKVISDYLIDLPEEGAEEFVQQEISENLQNYAVNKENAARKKDAQSAVELERIAGNITDQVADDLIKAISEQMPELDTIPQKEIFKDSLEAFKGGVMGAIALGIVPLATNSVATARDYKKTRDFVKETPSEAMVQQFLDNDPAGQKVKESFNEKQQETLAHDLYEQFNSERDAAENLKAKEISEVNSAADTFEDIETDEETGESNAAPVYRNESGELETSQETISQEGNVTTKRYNVFDPTKEGANVYGYLESEIDEDNDTVTIKTFDVNNAREGLRQEIFENFARDYAGYKIVWDAVGERAQNIKQELISNNPSGAMNELSYYSSYDEVADIKGRKEYAAKLKSVYKGNYTQDQLVQHVALGEALYNNLKKYGDIDDANFGEFINRLDIKGAKSQFAKGGFYTPDFEKNAKATIYVTQNGNFTTAVHEFAHFYRSLLQGEHLAEVSKAFGVKQNEDGTYEWKREDDERLAYGLENYLATGKAESAEQKKWYEKLCEFMADAMKRLHRAVKFTPEIEKVYQDMLDSGNKGVLAAAYRAVEEQQKNETNARKAEQQKKEAQQKQQQEKEQRAQTKEEQRANVDISAETTEANSQEFPLNSAEEAQIREERLAEDITREDITQTLADQGLSEETAKEVAEVLTDETATQVEKVEAALDAAAEVIEELPEGGLFQLIGELGATSLDRLEEVTTRMDNKKIAEDMFKAGKTVERIRLATGWEMTVDGKWRYEIKDDYHLKNNRKTNRKLKRYEEELKQAEKELAVYTEATEEEAAKIRRKIEVAVQHKAMPEGTTFESQQQEAQNKVDMYKNLIEFDGDLDVEKALRDFIENGVANPDNFWDIGESFYLNQIIDNEELFKAYPQLEHYVIEFTKKQDGHSGRLNPEDKVITIYPPAAISYAAFKSTLAHEVQHAIQHIEGFAEGGSASLFSEAAKPTEMQENIMLLAGIPKDQLLNYKEHEEWKTLQEYLPEALEKNVYGMGTLEQIMDRWINDVNNGVRTIDGIYDEIQDARTAYDKYHKINGFENEKTPMEKYHSLAGEVEARNVQRRLNMSDVERLNTLLLDTEDVAREDQIIMKGAVVMASEEVEAKRQDEVLAEAEEQQRTFDKPKTYDEAAEILKTKRNPENNTVHNDEMDMDAELSNANIKKMTKGQKLNDGVPASVHTVAIANLDKLFKEAVKAWSKPDRAADPNIKQIDRFIAPLYVDNEGYIAVITVKEFNNPDKNGLYTVEEINIQKNPAGLTVVANTDNIDLMATPLTGSSLNVIEKVRLVNNSISAAKEKSKLPEDTLYGVHNLSEEAIKHVFKMGGLANPSLAVMDKEKGVHTNFGSISLIAYNSLINKSTGKNSGTYGADVYSPRYPNITKTVTETGRKKLKSIFWAVEDENLRNHFIESTAQKFENERKPDFTYTKLPIAYLAEKGNKDFWQYKPTKFSDEIKEKIKSFGDNATVNNKEVAEYIKQVYTDQLAKSWNMDEVYARVKDGTATELDKSDLAAFDEAIKGDTDPDTGLLYYGKADNLLYDIRREIWDSNKIDEYATERKAREIVEFDQDFRKWAEEKYNSVEMDEKIFNGFTPSGNRRYLAHTLENVSKYMKAEGVRGGESINYGMGSARAMVTPKFSTLKQIRDNKDRLTDHATFEAAKDKLQDEYYWVTEKLQGSMDDYDVGDARFIESIEKGYFDADYIRREYKDVKMTEDDAQRISEFVQAMKEMPTEYFETKFERPIYTEDFGTSFAAAVLPENTDPAVIGKLEEQGLLIYKYKDSNDREAVTKQALELANQSRNILFQTQDELYADAMMFKTWQEFMEAYTTDFNPESFEDPEYHNQVPSDADAQWYQTTWELAHNIKPEESLNAEEQAAIVASDDTTAAALDAMFSTRMASDEAMLDDFLVRVAEIEEIDLNSPEYSRPQNEEEEAELKNIERLQDFIETQLNHGNWISNAKRVRNGDELTTTARKRIVSLIRSAPRDYRAIYAEIMGDQQYAVEEKDTVAAQLASKAKLTKYKAASPDSDFERMSPEKRRKIAEDMQNEDIARRIKSGKLTMDDEIEQYIRSLNNQIKEKDKELERLEKETREDYQSIADWQKRRLLELNEKLQIAKNNLDRKNTEVERLIAKGQKISGKYQKDVQNMRADYNEIFRKFNDLKDTIAIDVQVEEALKRQVRVYKAKEEIREKNAEKAKAQEVKDMRIKLVKRTMRRVPFNRIDYDNAKTIIAVQRMLEPNLLGGVNRWIGVDSPYLRGVVSSIITDSDYKDNLIKYLKKTSRASEANRKFIERIENLKSISDFEKWTKKEAEYAIRKLPKENWVKELNLLKLAEEREDSIDLDIDMKEKQRPARDPKTGEIRTNKDGQAITEATWELTYSPEIARMVSDAIGADMFNRLINLPFAEWTTEDLEKLAVRINELYTEGRDLLEAKKRAKIEAADQIRRAIEDAVKDTGIVINDDDSPEEKERKQKKIDKILGFDSTIKGTQQANVNKESRINRLLHGFVDANVRRVARILDNYSEGTNTNELYWKENEAYTAKTKSMNSRAVGINNVLQSNGITSEDLAKEVSILDRVFTVDELLYMIAADKDYVAKEDKEGSSLIDDNDDFAATSRNAVMFGNILSETENTEWKEKLAEQDKAMLDRINNGTLSTEEQQALTLGQLDKHPGLSQYINAAHGKYEAVIAAANSFLKENPKYNALLEAISNDYADQYDRMNEISIQEFNQPVHRTKAYVPLVRMESNGDTNENRVKEDLLATMGGNAKSWVNKGMTQRRVNMNPLNQKPVQMGLYKTWADSVERTEHFIAYAGYVRELNRVYKSRDAAYTRQFIESRYGKGMVRYIDDYINEVANPNANRQRSAADELMHTLRGKTAPAYLAWKASSVMKQAATSPWPYMQFVNPVTYLNACMKCLKPGTYDAIREKSVFMNNRRFDPLADLVDEMDEKSQNGFEKFMAKQSKIGMAGLEWIDWVAVAPGWLACYEKKYTELENNNQAVYEAVKKQLEEENAFADVASTSWKTKEQIEAAAHQAMMDDTEKRAVDYADDCVRLCQPSNRSVDISPLFKNNSEAWKAYLQFQTSLNVIWQNIRYDIPYAVRQKQFKQTAGIILGYAFAGIAMNSLMEGLTAGDDDDDKEAATVRKQIFNATTQFTDSVPLLGSALTAANQKIITGEGGFTSSGEDMTPMVTKFINTITRTAKALSEEDPEKQAQAWGKAAGSFAEGVGMYLGLPVQGIKELGKVAGVGDGDGSINLKLSEIADNELFNAIDEANPLN